MAETLTPHYGWTKPDPGASANTWGSTLNATTDKIDAQVFTNNARGVEIGTITMFAGAAAPANWLLCDGSSLSTTGTYAALFAVIGTAYNQSGDATGTFRVPNLVGRFPYGGIPGVAGGAATVTLDATMIPAHAHSVTLTQTPHTHTASSPPHTHNITDHQHTVNAVFGGGSEIQGGSGWGQHNIPSGGMTGATNVGAASAAVSVDPNNAAVSVTGGATGSVGGGAAHSNMPPYLSFPFIIKFA